MDAVRQLLICNAGSSSLKVQLLTTVDWTSRFHAVVERVGGLSSTLHVDGGGPEPLPGNVSHRAAAEIVFGRMLDAGVFDARIATVHRVVHGGAAFSDPVVVTREVFEALAAPTKLAPLHNPPALDVLALALERLAPAPAVAVFDTAFFRDLPEHVRTYAIPADWRRDGAVRRYGFHGLAHEGLYRGYRTLTMRGPSVRRMITLQLGHGCSAAALMDGRPVETSMGFTPLEGLIMGTRGGDLDPGIVMDAGRRGLSAAAIETALNHASGLLGLSERSADMRDLLELEAAGDSGAALAIAAFCHRVRKYVGAYAAALGGVDALVFGGGIGEHAPAIRSRICADFAWLGLALDERANAASRGTSALIGARSSAVDAAVVAVREERVIARHACERLGLDAAGLES